MRTLGNFHLQVENRPGVYCITTTHNGMKYIGSSSTVRSRARDHRNTLNRGRHGNPRLQAVWDKYGESVFKFEVLEYCSVEDCVLREQVFIDEFDTTNREKGYNLRADASTNLGMEKSRTKTFRCKFCEREFSAADVKASICPSCSKPRPCACGCGRAARNAKYPYVAGHKSKPGTTIANFIGHKKQGRRITGINNPSKRKK